MIIKNNITILNILSYMMGGIVITKNLYTSFFVDALFKQVTKRLQ